MSALVEVNNTKGLKKGVYLNFYDKDNKANPVFKHKLIQPKIQPQKNA